MADRPVHWHEGMFMGPHHLQAAQRYESSQRRKTASAGVHYNWGVQAIELNVAALANHRLEIRTLRAFMPDGTLVDVPEDGALPVLDLRAPLERAQSLMVYLAMPRVLSGQPNSTEERQSEKVRYLIEALDVEDENTGRDPQPVGFRLLNTKLLVGGTAADHAGFDVLPLARIIKTADATSTPQLDPTYIPPLLACNAWTYLHSGILSKIYDRVGVKIDIISKLIRDRGLKLYSTSGDDLRFVTQLRVLNEAYPVLALHVFARGVHPFDSYLELCRFVGQLAIFDAHGIRPPNLPPYDHDDLGKIFHAVAKYIHALLQFITEPDYVTRLFKGFQLQMRVDQIEPVWFEGRHQMFICVETSLPPAECVALFAGSGSAALDTKVGSSERVESLYKGGLHGVRFEPVAKPTTLPDGTYFKINLATSKPNEIEAVRQSRSLAVRFNEKIVVGVIDQAEELTVVHQRLNIRVRFILYVLPPAA